MSTSVSSSVGCAYLRTVSLVVILLGTGVAGGQTAKAPQAKLTNGPLQVTVDLPNATSGFYRGKRFDWSGVIEDLSFAGHSYYGPWFQRVDGSVRDYVFASPDVIASTNSGDSGPVEEFSALGYDTAKPGETFVKIGVGVLRKPDDQRYSFARNYETVDLPRWKVKVKKTSVEFSQHLLDPRTGYGYLYTKVLSLVLGEPRMLIEHSLKNIGHVAIATDVYDHNFTAIDHQPIGPDYSITAPFAIQLDRPLKPEMGDVEGNRIVYRKQLEDRESIDVRESFDPPQPGNDVRVENSRVKAGVRITGDHPLTRLELWSIRPVLGIEPFIHLIAAPGETIHWKYAYLFYTLPSSER